MDTAMYPVPSGLKVRQCTRRHGLSFLLPQNAGADCGINRRKEGVMTTVEFFERLQSSRKIEREEFKAALKRAAEAASLYVENEEDDDENHILAHCTEVSFEVRCALREFCEELDIPCEFDVLGRRTFCFNGRKYHYTEIQTFLCDGLKMLEEAS